MLFDKDPSSQLDVAGKKKIFPSKKYLFLSNLYLLHLLDFNKKKTQKLMVRYTAANLFFKLKFSYQYSGTPLSEHLGVAPKVFGKQSFDSMLNDA